MILFFLFGLFSDMRVLVKVELGGEFLFVILLVLELVGLLQIEDLASGDREYELVLVEGRGTGVVGEGEAAVRGHNP
jgi:hypothetical protein